MTWVLSLGQEDPLEEETATPSSIFAWKIPWTEGAQWATVCGIAKSQKLLSARAHTHTHTHTAPGCSHEMPIEANWEAASCFPLDIKLQEDRSQSFWMQP